MAADVEPGDPEGFKAGRSRRSKDAARLLPRRSSGPGYISKGSVWEDSKDGQLGVKDFPLSATHGKMVDAKIDSKIVTAC